MPNSETAVPGNPEPKPDATLRLPVGEPVNPNSTQRVDLSNQLDAGSTLRLPLGMPEPGLNETQRLALPRMDEPTVFLQTAEPPAAATGQTLKPTPGPGAARRKPFGWKLPLALGLLVVLGAVAFLTYTRNPRSALTPQPTPVSAGEPAPPAVQALLESAKAGDVHSMHLLGLMYYNGLNIPRDREKGLYWLRKAAEKGSEAARAELGQIEGGR